MVIHGEMEWLRYPCLILYLHCANNSLCTTVFELMAFVSVLVQDLSLRHLGFNVTKDQKYWWQNSCSSMEREFDRDSFITSVSVYDQSGPKRDCGHG